MAGDAQLLERVTADDRQSYVRIYRWVEPTVTLGYFQKDVTDVPEHLKSCPVVRRLSGGGAILHDREITYSCALPAIHPFCRRPQLLYTTIHRAISGLLNDLGVDAGLRGEADGDSRSAHPGGDVRKTPPGLVPEHFLCFLRTDPMDLICRGRKIVGSAQRRRRGAVLQHGSILLNASPLEPQIPGISDLTANFPAAEFCRLLPQVVGQCVSKQITIIDSCDRIEKGDHA